MMDPNGAFSEGTVGIPLHVNRASCTPMLEYTCACGFLAELRGETRVFEAQVVMPMARKRSGIRKKYNLDFVLDGKMIVELKGCPAPPPRPS